MLEIRGSDTSMRSSQGPQLRQGDADIPIDSKFTLKATGAEAAAYDYKAQRPPAKTINVFESIGHLVKSCLGCGIFSIHEAYMVCGLWTAFILNIFIGFAVAYCMHILVKSAQKVYGRVQIPAMTYPDLAEASLIAGPWDSMRKYGKMFRYAVDVFFIMYQIGTCCVYQVAMARYLKQLFEGTNDSNDEGNTPIRMYIVMFMVPCILICMIRTLKYLAPFAIVADLLIMSVAFATIYYGAKAATLSPFELPAFKTIAGLFEFIGTCVFSVEGVGITLPIENNMTEPKKMPLVIIGGMSIVVSMVMIIGFFGYWGYGEACKAPIIINFPMTQFTIVIKVFMILVVWVTFAINFWLPFNFAWVYIADQYSEDKHWLWERVYRATSIVIITAVSMCVPDVSNLMLVVGAFCHSNVGFIFPAFIELSLDWKDPGLGYMKWRLIKALSIVTFGLIIGIFGTYSNMKELVKTVFVTDKTSLNW